METLWKLAACSLMCASSHLYCSGSRCDLLAYLHCLTSFDLDLDSAGKSFVVSFDSAAKCKILVCQKWQSSPLCSYLVDCKAAASFFAENDLNLELNDCNCHNFTELVMRQTKVFSTLAHRVGVGTTNSTTFCSSFLSSRSFQYHSQESERHFSKLRSLVQEGCVSIFISTIGLVHFASKDQPCGFSNRFGWQLTNCCPRGADSCYGLGFASVEVADGTAVVVAVGCSLSCFGHRERLCGTIICCPSDSFGNHLSCC